MEKHALPAEAEKGLIHVFFLFLVFNIEIFLKNPLVL